VDGCGSLIVALVACVQSTLTGIAGSDENYVSHCSELSQLHQQPDEAMMLFFVQPLSGNSVINCRAL